MEKIDKPRVFRKSLFFVVLSAFTIGIFELVKQLIFPGITMWGSHILTIIAVSITSSCFAIFYFKNVRSIKFYKEELRKNNNSQFN